MFFDNNDKNINIGGYIHISTILSKPSVNKRQDQIGSIFSAMDILWIYYGHGYGYGYGYLSSRIRWPVRHAQRTVPGGSIRTAIGFRHFLLLMS